MAIEAQAPTSLVVSVRELERELPLGRDGCYILIRRCNGFMLGRRLVALRSDIEAELRRRADAAAAQREAQR